MNQERPNELVAKQVVEDTLGVLLVHADTHGGVDYKSTDVNRPGFRSVLQARMESMNQKYSVEMRERALRMLDEAKPDHPNLMAAVRHVAGLLGMSPETLRVWHRRREVDAGVRPGVPTDVAAENAQLRRENAELRKANEVLKAASVFFAKELDRP